MNAYHERITDLFDEYYAAPKDGKPAPAERIKAADEIIEDYIEKYGERPSKSILSRLATYILLDTLTDSHPDKMSRDEYPIMSYGQTGRYFERNKYVANIEYAEADVRGYHVGGERRQAIINARTNEAEAMDWRIFIGELLTDREAYIIERIFVDNATQTEVAAELGVSQPRVAKIMAGAFDKLRENIDPSML